MHKRLDKSMAKVIFSVLEQGYTKEELMEAATLYSLVLNDPLSRWTYKWRIEEFYKRTPGFRHFLPESNPLEKFTRRAGQYGIGEVTPPSSPVPPASKDNFLQRKRQLHDRDKRIPSEGISGTVEEPHDD